MRFKKFFFSWSNIRALIMSKTSKKDTFTVLKKKKVPLYHSSDNSELINSDALFLQQQV